ncbi:MAG: hypothetical protein JWM25_1208 [Thermoleophilia bacterium]|nr:hypothetical protein [Thermoleophilia bacterium]MCZ4496625.1 hypothetical protein [Thermoleophilia bacterium]
MEEPESMDPTNLADAPVIPTSETTQPAGYTPPVVDEARDWDIGFVDIILGLVTFPLLIWVMQYAFTGSEKLIATRQARLKVYIWLLAAEALIVALLVWWFAFR